MSGRKANILRRLMTATVLAGGMLSGLGLFAQDNGEALKKAVKMSEGKREAINKQLWKKSQLHFGEFYRAARTVYSDDLRELEKDINTRLARVEGHPHTHVAILDPLVATAGETLDLNNEWVLKYALGKKGISAMPFDYTEEAMTEAYFGTSVIPTARPSSFTSLNSERQDAAVIIASSPVLATGRHRVPGLTIAENLQFINLHEGWHALDNEYFFAGLDTAGFHKIDFEDAWQIAANPNAVKGLILGHKKEMLADVGAAGDMIHGGIAREKLEHIAAFREKSSYIAYITIIGLRLLGDKIDGMGIENFRKLDDVARYSLYTDVVEEAALSPEGYKIVADYKGVSDEKRAAWEEQAKTDPKVKNALSYTAYFNRLGAPMPEHDTPVPQARLDARKALDSLKWDPLQEMKDLAFKNDGRITPLTLTRAYAQMQSALQRQAKEGVESADMLIAKMEKLETTYVWNLKWIDYVMMNATRGISPKKTSSFDL